MACNKLLLSRPRSMENTLAERMMIHRDGGGIVAEYDDSDDCYDYNYDPGSSVFTETFKPVSGSMWHSVALVDHYVTTSRPLGDH